MTLHQRLKRAICCPDGCCSPADCYANGHRDVPVKLDAAARAVGAVIREAWAEQARGVPRNGAQEAVQGGEAVLAQPRSPEP